MAQFPSTAMGAKRAPFQPPPGELLEDRIRDGIAGSLTEQIAIGLQIGRALSGWHSKQRFLEQLSSAAITIDAEDNVTLFGPESNDSALRYQNTQGFGIILYELFTGKLMCDHESPEPEMEMLHKAGLPPSLIDVVTQCLDKPEDSKAIDRSTARLKSALRERLGEPDTSPKPYLIAAALAGVALAAFLAWKFLL